MTSTTVHYVIGHNLSGYLPESEPACFGADWQAAADSLVSEMRNYASEDDESTADTLYDIVERSPDEYPRDESGAPDFGDDAPSMLATVGAILTDDGPRDGAEWSAIVEDGRGHNITFWLMSVPADDCGAEQHGDDE